MIVGDFPAAIKGRFYSHTMQATGGSGNYLWTISSGMLPPGLWLDAQTGLIHGKLARKGSWTFQIMVQDAQNSAGTSGPAVVTINVGLYSG